MKFISFLFFFLSLSGFAEDTFSINLINFLSFGYGTYVRTEEMILSGPKFSSEQISTSESGEYLFSKGYSFKVIDKQIREKKNMAEAVIVVKSVEVFRRETYCEICVTEDPSTDVPGIINYNNMKWFVDAGAIKNKVCFLIPNDPGTYETYAPELFSNSGCSDLPVSVSKK